MLTEPEKQIGYEKIGFDDTKNTFHPNVNRFTLPKENSIDKLFLVQLLEQIVAGISWAPTDARTHVHRLGGTLHLDRLAATLHVADETCAARTSQGTA